VVRSSSRTREVAIRSAVGATRARLVRQMLVESLALSISGGMIGVALANGLVTVIVRYAPADLARLYEVHLDVRLLAFAFALSLVIGMLVGLLPALRFARGSSHASTTSAFRTKTSGAAGHRIRSSLVSIEVAAAVICLLVGGLLLNSLIRLLNVDRGF